MFDNTTEGLRQRVLSLARVLGYGRLTLDAGGSSVDARVTVLVTGAFCEASGTSIDWALENLRLELMGQARARAGSLQRAMESEE